MQGINQERDFLDNMERKLLRDDNPNRPGPDFWNALGASCSWLINMHGINRAMHFLAGMLKNSNHVARINVGCASLANRRFFVPLCDTFQGGMEYTRIPSLKNPFSIISEQTLDQPTIIYDLSEFKSRAMEVDSSVSALPFFRHLSVLRLPLFKKDNLLFYINFFSDEKCAFAESDIKLYSTMLEPCIENMKAVFAGDFKPVAEAGLSMPEYMHLSKLPGMTGVWRQICQVAPTNATVLISGESGVGKESVAEALHELSKRKNERFVRVNCGAFAPSLLASELFGAEKGAYTGSMFTRCGCFEYAQGGTIFLDEVGELSSEAQASLLRVLDKREIQRVGSPRGIAVNVRVIAATNKNLQEMIANGAFRQDLYYRLSAYPIHVPPLRRRREDILVLAKIILQMKTRELALKMEPKITAGVEARLLTYDWPGNVRELANVLERSLINNPSNSKILQIELADTGNVSKKEENAWLTLAEVEREHISKTLAKTAGKLSGDDGAAALLGIHYTTLHAKLKKYGLKSS